MPWDQTRKPVEYDEAEAIAFFDEEMPGRAELRPLFLKIARRIALDLPLQGVLLVGTPASGKDHFAKVIAKWWGVPHAQAQLPREIKDGYFKGDRFIWVGSDTGTVPKKMIEGKSSSLVLVHDEADKCPCTDQLLELTDGNSQHVDRYFGCDVPQRNVLHIFTANDDAPLSGAFTSRNPPNSVGGYLPSELVGIAQRAFVPKLVALNGQFAIDDAAISRVIRDYAPDARMLDQVMVDVYAAWEVSGDHAPITEDRIQKLLRAPTVHVEQVKTEGAVGRAPTIALEAASGKGVFNHLSFATGETGSGIQLKCTPAQQMVIGSVTPLALDFASKHYSDRTGQLVGVAPELRSKCDAMGAAAFYGVVSAVTKIPLSPTTCIAGHVTPDGLMHGIKDPTPFIEAADRSGVTSLVLPMSALEGYKTLVQRVQGTEEEPHELIKSEGFTAMSTTDLLPGGSLRQVVFADSVLNPYTTAHMLGIGTKQGPAGKRALSYMS